MKCEHCRQLHGLVIHAQVNLVFSMVHVYSGTVCFRCENQLYQNTEVGCYLSRVELQSQNNTLCLLRWPLPQKGADLTAQLEHLSQFVPVFKTETAKPANHRKLEDRLNKRRIKHFHQSYPH